MNFTYTPEWSRRKPNLIPVPREPEEKIVLLTQVVVDLVDAIMEDKGWDSPMPVIDRCLADECVKMAWWALEQSRSPK